MRSLKWIVLVGLCLSLIVVAQNQQLPEPVGRPSLVIEPQILVFSSKELREKSIFVYNTNLKSDAKWSLVSSKFIRVSSDLPNPLPPLSGGYLKVSVNWNQVETDMIRVENPELLHKLLSQILGTELPSKPIGFGLISIKEEVGRAVYIHIVKVVLLK